MFQNKYWETIKHVCLNRKSFHMISNIYIRFRKFQIPRQVVSIVLWLQYRDYIQWAHRPPYVPFFSCNDQHFSKICIEPQEIRWNSPENKNKVNPLTLPDFRHAEIWHNAQTLINAMYLSWIKGIKMSFTNNHLTYPINCQRIY